jgi:modification methylase
VAKKLNRHWIGIENNAGYVELAQERLNSIQVREFDPIIFEVQDKKRHQQRIPFGNLIENGLLSPGQHLYFNGDKNIKAIIKTDGNLFINDFTGSIHQTAKHLNGGKPSNGWQLWYYETPNGAINQIDELRSEFTSRYKLDLGENTDLK